MVSSDEVLEYLVQKTEETSVDFSVTLTIGGLVITGEMIRSKRYYDDISRLFETYTEKLEGKTAKNIVIHETKDAVELETLENYYKDFKEFMINMRSKNHENNRRPKYIHLQNVEVWEIFSTDPFDFNIGAESCHP
jgi:hypothetical protein